jgi:hypothetical protein
VTVLFTARTGPLQKLGRRYTVLPIEAKVRAATVTATVTVTVWARESRRKTEINHLS